MAKKDEEVKAGVEDGVSKDTTSTQPKKETAKKIEVSEDTLRQLIAENQQLKADVIDLQKNAVVQTEGSLGSMVKTKTKETLLKVKMWNGKIFLGYKNVGTDKRPNNFIKEYDEKSREYVEYCLLLLDGEKDPVKVNYIDFQREADRVYLKQVSKKEEELVTNQGYVQKKDFADNGYGMFETMVQVPVDIIEKRYTFIVETEDGRTLELSQEALG